MVANSCCVVMDNEQREKTTINTFELGSGSPLHVLCSVKLIRHYTILDHVKGHAGGDQVPHV